MSATSCEESIEGRRLARWPGRYRGLREYRLIEPEVLVTNEPFSGLDVDSTGVE